MRRRGWGAALVAAAMMGLPSGAMGQVSDAVSDMDRGVLRFSFETRPGVEICDNGVRMDGDRVRWRSGGMDAMETCSRGPAQVELRVVDGRVHGVDVVTPRERTAEAREVGEIPPGEAAGYLVSLAYRGATSGGAEDAVFPAMLADVDGVWRELLVLAQDRDVYTGVRKNALFWLGQEAADAVTDGVAGVARDETEDQEVREAAVFALSQRGDEAAVTALMEIATTAEQAETRRTAMFWLAQSEDPRVTRFFEDILLRKGL